MQLGLGLEPFGGRFSIARAAPANNALPAPAATPDVVLDAAGAPPSTTRPAAAAALPAARPASTGGLATLSIGGVGLALWLACSAAALLGLALAWGRLVARLHRRQRIRTGPLLELVHDLARRAGYRRRVRLSVVPALRVPISLGWLRPEICLPPRALVELDGEEQEALLAHELAHLARRDPAWLWFMRIDSGVLFFQPLNRLARREIEDCAEILCDAWAVSHTGLRLSLASCLAQVAGWVVAERRALPAPAMALKSSRLRVRVESLLDEEHAQRLARPPRGLLLSLPLAAGFATVLVLVAPAVSSQARGAPRAGNLASDAAATERPESDAAAPVPELGSFPDLRELPELRELIRLLDGELEALDHEFAELRADIGRDEAFGLLRDSLASLETKLELLRARRARLASLFDGPAARGAVPVAPVPRTLENLR